ncbi:hypothetical protein BGX29_002791 [Mortierella sp. GBA35]|nr:hypothetical protein BGX29_002791 [Mortierella sp. GBA35]
MTDNTQPQSTRPQIPTPTSSTDPQQAISSVTQSFSVAPPCASAVPSTSPSAVLLASVAAPSASVVPSTSPSASSSLSLATPSAPATEAQGTLTVAAPSLSTIAPSSTTTEAQESLTIRAASYPSLTTPPAPAAEDQGSLDVAAPSLLINTPSSSVTGAQAVPTTGAAPSTPAAQLSHSAAAGPSSSEAPLPPAGIETKKGYVKPFDVYHDPGRDYIYELLEPVAAGAAGTTLKTRASGSQLTGARVVCLKIHRPEKYKHSEREVEALEKAHPEYSKKGHPNVEEFFGGFVYG